MKENTKCDFIITNNSTALLCSNKQITDALLIQNILPNVQSINTLQRLNFSTNKITDDGIMSLKNLITANTQLTFIDLQSNQISTKGIQILFEALAGSTKIETLKLSHNPAIGDEGITIILQFLEKNTSLKKLYVDNCNLTHHNSAGSLTSMLKNNLITLSLRYNTGLTNETAKQIIAILENNSTIETIDLEFTEVGSEMLTQIKQLLPEKKKVVPSILSNKFQPTSSPLPIQETQKTPPPPRPDRKNSITTPPNESGNSPKSTMSPSRPRKNSITNKFKALMPSFLNQKKPDDTPTPDSTFIKGMSPS